MSETDNPMQAIITKCWEDEAFRERLLADPAATLAAEGLKVPEGVTVNVAIDSDDVRTLVIPLAPAGALSDGVLSDVSAGARCDHSMSGSGCAFGEFWLRPDCLEDGAPNL